MINCTFIDNISDNDGGAAISNVGVSESSGSWFSGNVFNCEPGTYLDVVDGIRYEKVCEDAIFAMDATWRTKAWSRFVYHSRSTLKAEAATHPSKHWKWMLDTGEPRRRVSSSWPVITKMLAMEG